LQIAAASLVVCLTVFSFIYARYAEESRQALLAMVDTDLAGLVDIYHSGGKDGLSERIEDRLALSGREADAPYYRLEDAGAKTLAGNLKVWPSLDATLSQSGFIKVSGVKLLARATVLKGGLRLVVGRSAMARQQALTLLVRLFVAASVMIVLLGFLVGRVAAGRIKRRVLAVNDALTKVRQGQLDARVAVGKHGDELNDLSHDVNLMLDRVENLVAAQRDVTDNIAHETRTPLMQLDASLLKALEACHQPVVAEALEKGRGQIRSLLRLYDALLDIAANKGRRGDTASLTEIDLSAVAESLVDLYQASADEAGIQLDARIEPGVVMQADAMQMSHLIVNLLDNAFKYGAAGKYIGFRVSCGPVIVVEDKGPGVGHDDRAAIFQRYNRMASGASPGHGLGLALVKAIAARHGLTVRVEDFEPGASAPGARFVVTGEEAECSA